MDGAICLDGSANRLIAAIAGLDELTYPRQPADNAHRNKYLLLALGVGLWMSALLPLLGSHQTSGQWMYVPWAIVVAMVDASSVKPATEARLMQKL